MATYKGINGYAVQSIASDPSLDEGQVWYNNATYAIKLASLSTVGTWASGGNLNTARYALDGAGSQTAAVVFGGNAAPGPTGATELYNGTSWTTTTPLTTSRFGVAGAGTQTVGLAFGGATPPASNATEEFTGAFLSTKKITTS